MKLSRSAAFRAMAGIIVCLGVGITGSIVMGIESRVWVPAAAAVGTVVGVVAFRAAARTP